MGHGGALDIYDRAACVLLHWQRTGCRIWERLLRVRAGPTGRRGGIWVVFPGRRPPRADSGLGYFRCLPTGGGSCGAFGAARTNLANNFPLGAEQAAKACAFQCNRILIRRSGSGHYLSVGRGDKAPVRVGGSPGSAQQMKVREPRAYGGRADASTPSGTKRWLRGRGR